MGNIIIGIHGLSNKPAPEILEKGWQEAMLEGLAKNVKITPSYINFTSVYWADVMYPQYDTHANLYHPAKDGHIKRYKDCWLDEFRAKSSDIFGDILDRFKKLYGIDHTADRILSKKLKDLYIYYHNKEKRKILRDRLEKEILKNKDKRIMIVAHSMGTIIAYDVLRALGKKYPSLSIDHFITIGSPLGLPHVKYRIIEENPLVRTPTIVKKWTNFADKRDPVAIDTHLSDDYDSNSYGVKVRDDLVLNDWGGIHHKSYGYLRTPEFSDELKRFL